MNRKARAAARRKKRQQLRKQQRVESAATEAEVPIKENETEGLAEVEVEGTEGSSTMEDVVAEDETMEDDDDMILIELQKQPPQVRSLTGTVPKNARRCLNPVVFLEEDDLEYKDDIE